MSIRQSPNCDSIQTFRARWVFPITSPAIENGFVRVRARRVVEVGKFSSRNSAAKSTSNVRDLGDVALLPGLVNAHTHLEFSDLRTPIGEPGIDLADWIALAIAARNKETDNGDLKGIIEQGLAETSESGTVLLADIATTPYAVDLPTSSLETRCIPFAEVLGLNEVRARDRFTAARSHLAKHLPNAGISPHAPYSTSLQTIQDCVQLATQHNCPLAMHVAECPSERELLQQGTGPFALRLRDMGLEPENWFPWHDDSRSNKQPIVGLIDMLAGAPRVLLIHGNDLQTNEIASVSQHANFTVVMCPRTHAFFQHKEHPIQKLLKAGVNVALGTDSRASNPDLNLWSEVQFLLRHRPDIHPHEILKAATLGGAVALGEESLYGSITRGSIASWVMVPTQAMDVDQCYSAMTASLAMPVG